MLGNVHAKHARVTIRICIAYERIRQHLIAKTHKSFLANRNASACSRVRIAVIHIDLVGSANAPAKFRLRLRQ